MLSFALAYSAVEASAEERVPAGTVSSASLLHPSACSFQPPESLSLKTTFLPRSLTHPSCFFVVVSHRIRASRCLARQASPRRKTASESIMPTQESGASSRMRPRQPGTDTSSTAADEQIEPFGLMSRSPRISEESGDTASRRQAPKRRPSASRGLPFVIQMRGPDPIRYDFRLSWGGVLKSWAVAQGPSYNPQ